VLLLLLMRTWWVGYQNCYMPCETNNPGELLDQCGVINRPTASQCTRLTQVGSHVTLHASSSA
jgi:hypothetical protein